MIHHTIRGLPVELRYDGPAEAPNLGIYLGGVCVAYFHPEGFMVVPCLPRTDAMGPSPAVMKLTAARIKVRTGPCLSVVRLADVPTAATEGELPETADRDCLLLNNMTGKPKPGRPRKADH